MRDCRRFQKHRMTLQKRDVNLSKDDRDERKREELKEQGGQWGLSPKDEKE